ncbi:MAG: hypothetical protein KIT72_19540 [Polyangiaceae bacterium]|nr:hypothetical protein [Polyangiaceae bacterium]MCW5792615.1 hypothetical protein [Polyangiaceae bacterium]
MAEELFNRVCEPGNEDSLFAATVWLTIDGTVFLDLPGDDPVALADTAAAEFRRVHEDFVDLLTAEYPEVQIPPGQGGDPFVTIIAPGMDLLQITRVPGVDTVSISIDESAAGYQ